MSEELTIENALRDAIHQQIAMNNKIYNVVKGSSPINTDVSNIDTLTYDELLRLHANLKQYEELNVQKYRIKGLVHGMWIIILSISVVVVVYYIVK